MSIYPVKLIEWFPMTDELTHIARTVVEYSKCKSCGRGGMKYHRAYGHHSIPWGYGDVWCSKKCLNK